MNIFENKPLSSVTFYQIGGTARYILEITDKKTLEEAFHFIKENNITDTRVVGLGSNLIFPDTHFDGVVLWFHGDGTSAVSYDDTVHVFSGDTVDSLIKYSFSQELVGLEWAGGLPSTVGGAVRGNAGAFGSEMKDTVLSVEVVDLKGAEFILQTFSKQESTFSYRNSYFKEHPHLLIVNATFQLQKGTKDELQLAKEVYEQNKVFRERNHPMEYPSCGSVFKNITNRDDVEKILMVWPEVRKLSEEKWHNKVSMGYLIKRLGFSGKRIGGAQVSEKHANYISNIDHAKAEDVKQLITTIQNTFKSTFGFIPEPEVIII